MDYQDDQEVKLPARAVDYSSSNPALPVPARVPLGNPAPDTTFNPNNLILSPPGAPTNSQAPPSIIRSPFEYAQYRQMFAQNDRSELNDILGQQPETGFLQKPKPTPSPVPTPKYQPEKENSYYYG